MHIVMVTDSLRSGGKERRLIELLKGLSVHGHSCDVIILSNTIEYPEFYTLKIPYHCLPRKSRWDPGIFRRISKLLGMLKPDVIHVWESMSAFYTAPVARIKGIPFVNAMITNAPDHLGFFNPIRIISAITFGLADAVVGNSEAGLSAYRAPRHKSYCVYNGLDMNRIAQLANPEKVKKELGIQPDQLVVGMVASFYNHKDYPTYLNAAGILIESGLPVVFICIGDGPNLKTQRMASDTKYSGRIIFTGKISNVESVVNIFDVGVLLGDAEGISNAIMEYMVLEKPVIASDGGGTSEIVVDGVTGYVIPKRSVNALTDKLELLLKNFHLRKQMGLKGRERIKTAFSLQAMTRNFIVIYQKLLDKQ